jgi:hypothetical protein
VGASEGGGERASAVAVVVLGDFAGRGWRTAGWNPNSNTQLLPLVV